MKKSKGAVLKNNLGFFSFFFFWIFFQKKKSFKNKSFMKMKKGFPAQRAPPKKEGQNKLKRAQSFFLTEVKKKKSQRPLGGSFSTTLNARQTTT